MRLRYTKRAAKDLAAVLTHIDDASPQGAKRVKDKLTETIALLFQYPSAGRLTTKSEKAHHGVSLSVRRLLSRN